MNKSLEKLSNEELAEVMPWFVMEACRRDKNPHPLSTLMHEETTIIAVSGIATSARVIQQTVTITKLHPDSPVQESIVSWLSLAGNG